MSELWLKEKKDKLSQIAHESRGPHTLSGLKRDVVICSCRYNWYLASSEQKSLN